MKAWIISGTVACTVLAAAASAQYLGPSGYVRASDSPLLGPAYQYFHLENFADVGFTPGLTLSTGLRSLPGPLIDSVDEDDGVVDGSGTGGSSWYCGGAATSIEIAFGLGALGNLPTHAGFVWTDVGIVSAGSFGISDVTVEAFDSANVSLGLFGPFELGNGLITGETAEDRFFGIVHAGGISRIVVSMPNSQDWEIDHVQYGYVPSPAAGILLLAAAGAGRRRRTI